MYSGKAEFFTIRIYLTPPTTDKEMLELTLQWSHNSHKTNKYLTVHPQQLYKLTHTGAQVVKEVYIIHAASLEP